MDKIIGLKIKTQIRWKDFYLVNDQENFNVYNFKV